MEKLLKICVDRLCLGRTRFRRENLKKGGKKNERDTRKPIPSRSRLRCAAEKNGNYLCRGSNLNATRIGIRKRLETRTLFGIMIYGLETEIDKNSTRKQLKP